MKNTIKQYCAFLLTVIVILFTCADNEEFWVLDNPLDPQGNNWFPPSVEAMQDTTVGVYDSFYVHATGSDSNGTIYYYLWGIDDTNYTDTVNTNTFKIAFSTAGVKPVKVKVIDSDWLVSAPDSVDITVKSYAPTVVAMEDTTVAVNDSFYVHATGSDSNRTVEKYVWALDGSNYNDTLDTNVFKIIFSSVGVRTIAVKVIDDDSIVSVPDSVNITVKDKAPINASPANNSTDQSITPTLRWVPGFYDASFTVFLDTLNPPVQEATTALTDTFYTVTTSLEYNKTYYWHVAGFDTTGDSDTSGVWSFTTLKEITGLVAHYPFNGNANDFSGNDNHGSVSGATPTSDRFGNLNAAYLYNGSGNYISIPNLTPIQNVPINQFSFVAWMKSLNGDGSTPQNVFEVHTQAASGNREVYFEANMPEAMRFGICDTTGGDHQIQSAVLSLNSWYQVVGTYDGSEQKIYINALLHDSQPWSGYFTITPGAMLGKDIEGGQYFNGAIDDIRIYNHALDSAEIHSLYHAGGWDTTTNIDEVRIYNRRLSEAEILFIYNNSVGKKR